MYSKRPSFIIGFHGCDLETRNKIILHQSEMKQSTNDYDWLGEGFYFWENNYKRAELFAREKQKREKQKKDKETTPAVLGAYIDLGNCLDLLDSKNLEELKKTYEMVKSAFEFKGLKLPENKTISTEADLLLRPLDCAVIQAYTKNSPIKIDSVRGVFWEGNDLYPGAGMKEKNHIQICVRNINCIKGFFIPRELTRELKP